MPMTTNELARMEEQNIARLVRELASNLADAVESGDMTAEEANAWMVMKQDQWVGRGPWG